MRLRGWAGDGRACAGRGLAEISAFSMSLMSGSASVWVVGWAGWCWSEGSRQTLPRRERVGLKYSRRLHLGALLRLMSSRHQFSPIIPINCSRPLFCPRDARQPPLRPRTPRPRPRPVQVRPLSHTSHTQRPHTHPLSMPGPTTCPSAPSPPPVEAHHADRSDRLTMHGCRAPSSVT